MADGTTLSDDDQGKPVVDDNGEKVGVVSDVRGGTAHVDPDPGVTDKVKSRLGWSDADADDYPLADDEIATVTDDEIRLA
ncbi:PRC-barrel domain containing protein [Halosimplex halophilum]|uniref:PRC-barrel domain containing protein n=1 Tax=Halosimplex halophilum TaxID=2559572 RepID=UPI00107F4209|nr:PRC-barrel domain containing protein [Halosimplex halophilum]